MPLDFISIKKYWHIIFIAYFGYIFYMIRVVMVDDGTNSLFAL